METASPPPPATAGLPGVTPPEPGGIGAVVHDADVRRLDTDQLTALRALVHEHKLVVLRSQDPSDAEYVAFARALGTPQIYFQDNYHHPRHPEIFVSSNVPMDGEKVGVAGTGRYWHTDCQFFDQPLPFTLLLPKVLPDGARETFYIDMERVWRELPAALKERVADARAFHEAKWRYKVQPCDVDKSVTELLEAFGAITPRVEHPVVLRHPVHDRELLYVSEGFTRGICGLPCEESDALLAELLAFIDQPDHVHTHRWEEGDLLVWDNRQLLHMASTTPPGQSSVSYRIGVYDGLPFYTNDPGRVAAG